MPNPVSITIVAQPSKSSAKVRSVDARQRAQARREAIAKQDRNRKLMFGGLWSAVALVVVVVIVLVVVNQVQTSNGQKNVTAPAPAVVTSDLSTIPESAFAAAGVTKVGSQVAGIKMIGGTPVLTNGLPTVIYVGGEFCPYCAAERWALAASLERFGSLSDLYITRSAATDGNYATLSFIKARYSSKYIAFSGSEQEDRAHNPLQTVPAPELASFTKYGGSAYPYLSINDAYQSSVQYDVSLLGTMTAEQIAAAIKDPSTKLGAAVLASANVLTAGICAETKQQPAAVCGATEVKAAAAFTNTGASAGSGSSSSGS